MGSEMCIRDSDEIFVNTEQVFFDRNRLYGALGYQINKSTQVQVGYLRQRVNAFGKNYLQFAVVFNPDLRKAFSPKEAVDER